MLSGAVIRISVTASGSTSAASAGGSPSRASALSIITGRAASEERVLNATAWAGAAAAAKRRTGMPAPRAVAG
jgi:hypothetical protein